MTVIGVSLLSLSDDDAMLDTEIKDGRMGCTEAAEWGDARSRCFWGRRCSDACDA